MAFWREKTGKTEPSNKALTREETLLALLKERFPQHQRDFGDIRFEPSVIEGNGTYIVDATLSVSRDRLKELGLEENIDFQKDKHPTFRLMVRYKIDQTALERAFPSLKRDSRTVTE